VAARRELLAVKFRLAALHNALAAPKLTLNK
jgi:hypothetical protein